MYHIRTAALASAVQWLPLSSGVFKILQDHSLCAPALSQVTVVAGSLTTLSPNFALQNIYLVLSKTKCSKDLYWGGSEGLMFIFSLSSPGVLVEVVAWSV